MVKEERVPEINASYQYVLELKERLDETMKLAQAELERNHEWNKKLYNRKKKKRVFSGRRQGFGALPTDHNKLLMNGRVHLK